jgi:hypothetical protein
VSIHDGLAERSKALDLGSSPKGRGFKSHSRHHVKDTAFSFTFVKCEAQAKTVFSVTWYIVT